MRTRVDLLLLVFYPAVEIVAALASALNHLVRRRRRPARCADDRRLVAFMQYAQRFFRPISDMSEKFNVLQSAMASSERIFGLLDEPVVIAPQPNPVARPPGAAGHIVFETSGSRTTAGQARRRMPTRLRAERRQLRGQARPARRHRRRDGFGQDDTHQLAAPVLRRHRGRITVDGVDIRDLALADLRGLFSLVLQDVHLFSGTIEETSGSGAMTSTKRKMMRAAKAVHADHLSSDCRIATRRRWPNAGRRFRSGRSSCCRSPAPWRSTLACSS